MRAQNRCPLKQIRVLNVFPCNLFSGTYVSINKGEGLNRFHCPLWKAEKEVYGEGDVRNLSEMNSLMMWKAF